MQTKRLFLAALTLIVAVLAGVMIFVLRPSGGEPDPVVAPQHRPAEPAVPETAAPLERDPAPVDVRGASAEPLSRTPVETAEEGLKVVVVDRATSARVSGAIVTYASDAELLARRDPKRSWIGSLEETLAEVGRTATTDANGEAWIAPRSRPATACARHADRWNYRAVTQHGEGTLTIELVPDRSVTLQVVDDAGNPKVGVPVALLSTSSQGFTFALWQERTAAPDGTAVVRHFDPLLESVARRQSLSAGFDFLLAEPDDVPIDPANLPRDPIQLVLPPTGAVDVSLEVEARYASSLQGALSGEVWLENADPRPPRGIFIQKTAARDGRALFTHVGLDLNVVAKAKNIAGFKPASERAPGPHVNGETVRIAVRFDDPYPTLVGRLVDSGGRPLALRTLQGRTEVETEEGPLATATLPAQSDADGRVRIVLQILPLPGLDGRANLEVLGRDQVLEGHAVIKLPAFLQRGDNVVGDIVVETVERLVSGFVFDEAEKPIPGVWVYVQRGTVLDAPLRSDAADAAAPVLRWLVVPGVQAQTDREGAFVVLGKRPDGPTRVVVHHEGYLRVEGPEFSRGKSDIVIHLAKSGTIEGSLITPDHFPLDTLTVLVTPAAQSATAGRPVPKPRVVPVALDRTYQAADLPSGSYTVEVSIKGDDKPLATIPGVVVRGGEIAPDSRLYDIQLSNVVRCFRIDVLDVAGAPIPEASVSVATGPAQRRTYKVTGRQARVVAREDAVDLEVTAPGFRPVTLRRVSSDRTVVLEPRLAVELALAPGVSAPEPPYYLGLKFIPVNVSDADVTRDGHDHTSPFQPALERSSDVEGDLYFDETGRLRAGLPGPGSYRLEWSVTYTAKGVGAGSTLPPFDQDRIDVPDVPGVQYFEVAPDAAQYARVLSEMRAGWGDKQ